MDGIIAIIIIVSILSKFVSQMKKAKRNTRALDAARQEAASRPKAPQPARPLTTIPDPVTAATSQGSFWEQMSAVLQEQSDSGTPEKGHEAVGSMAEGDSRECAHGSIGGSMAYEKHTDGAQAEKPRKRAAFEETKAEDGLYRPAMNAKEMRQAVVMAEILKRPQERMAEQARRWSVR